MKAFSPLLFSLSLPLFFPADHYEMVNDVPKRDIRVTVVCIVYYWGRRKESKVFTHTHANWVKRDRFLFCLLYDELHKIVSNSFGKFSMHLWPFQGRIFSTGRIFISVGVQTFSEAPDYEKFSKCSTWSIWCQLFTKSSLFAEITCMRVSWAANYGSKVKFPKFHLIWRGRVVITKIIILMKIICWNLILY